MFEQFTEIGLRITQIPRDVLYGYILHIVLRDIGDGLFVTGLVGRLLFGNFARGRYMLRGGLLPGRLRSGYLAEPDGFVYSIDQFPLIAGLEQVVESVHRDGCLGVGKLVKSGQEDDAAGPAAPADFFGRFQPVNTGHLNIQDHDLRVFTAVDLQRLAAVLGDQDRAGIAVILLQFFL